MPSVDDADLSRTVDELIADQSGRFHCGSLIRCTVEQRRKGIWIGTGGGMLENFVASPFGLEVSSNCAMRMLGNLSPRTRLIVMFGLGAKKAYVKSAFDLYSHALPGDWHWVNGVTYTNGKLTVVHVEHFASQGRLLPSWLGLNGNDRATLGELAQQGVVHALGPIHASTRTTRMPVLKKNLCSAHVSNVGLNTVAPPPQRRPAIGGSTGAAEASELMIDAEAILASKFARLKKPGVKIATFRTANGRHIALSKDLKTSIKVWVEEFPEEGMSGVTIDNSKNPGHPYDSAQARSSNVNFIGSRLAVGKKAYYLQVETLGALNRLVSWYEAV